MDLSAIWEYKSNSNRLIALQQVQRDCCENNYFQIWTRIHVADRRELKGEKEGQNSVSCVVHGGQTHYYCSSTSICTHLIWNWLRVYH